MELDDGESELLRIGDLYVLILEHAYVLFIGIVVETHWRTQSCCPGLFSRFVDYGRLSMGHVWYYHLARYQTTNRRGRWTQSEYVRSDFLRPAVQSKSNSIVTNKLVDGRNCSHMSVMPSVDVNVRNPGDLIGITGSVRLPTVCRYILEVPIYRIRFVGWISWPPQSTRRLEALREGVCTRRRSVASAVTEHDHLHFLYARKWLRRPPDSRRPQTPYNHRSYGRS